MCIKNRCSILGEHLYCKSVLNQCLIPMLHYKTCLKCIPEFWERIKLIQISWDRLLPRLRIYFISYFIDCYGFSVRTPTVIVPSCDHFLMPSDFLYSSLIPLGIKYTVPIVGIPASLTSAALSAVARNRYSPVSL